MPTVGPGLDIQTFGADLVMSWLSVPGQMYQIEYKDDLNANAWTPLGSPLAGNGDLLTVTNRLSSSPQRYYRLSLSF